MSIPNTQYSWERPSDWLTNFLDNRLENSNSKSVSSQNSQTVRRRGLQRHLLLAVDNSAIMSERDFGSASRLELTLFALRNFITGFFDLNPLSQIQLVQMVNGVANTKTYLSGNSQQHLAQLSLCNETQGEVSLQNVLQVARTALENIAQYGTREVLIIFGGLTTCDPGNINSTLKTIIKNKIKVSIIGLAAEVFVCKTIAQKTGGQYNVILNEKHFTDLLTSYLQPPKIDEAELQELASKSTFVEMGFPLKVQGPISAEEILRVISKKNCEGFSGDTQKMAASFCGCHQELTTVGYICPRCLTKL